MRKIITYVVGTAIAASLFPLAACGGGAEKTSYHIKAEFFEGEALLRCEMTVNVVNNTDAVFEKLPFELWANAYREGAVYRPVSELYAPAAYYDGESWGGISVTAVEGGTFTVGGEDENILYVTPESPLYPDESASFTMNFDVKLARVDHRLGIGQKSVNLSGFYPILCTYRQDGFYECVYSAHGDPFVSDCADYSVELTVPAKYDVAGAELASKSNDKCVFLLEADNVRDVAFVLSDSFTRTDGKAGGVPVSYYSLTDPDPSATLATACEAVEFCAETFGDYAYPRYTVAETDFPYGGMEFPMLSMISCSVAETQRPPVVVHETAHQWWYASVGSDQFAEAWQDEGLAEWTTALFMEAHPQYGIGYRDAVNASEKSYRAFFSVKSQVNGEADTRMSRPLTDFTGLYEYRNIAYDKGVILFDRIRDVAGEQKLIKGLKNYAAEFGGKLATPADLVACLTSAGIRAEELVRSFTEGKCVI